MEGRAERQLGSYRLLRLLGEGQFTEVYLGEHLPSAMQVAVKVLTLQMSAEELAEFLIQARGLAQLQHPHIVPALDFGAAEGIAYVVMAYAPHGTLYQRHPRGTTLPLT